MILSKIRKESDITLMLIPIFLSITIYISFHLNFQLLGNLDVEGFTVNID